MGAYPNTIANLHILEDIKMPIKKQIAYRFFSAKSAPMYVSDLRGDGGVDWGYTKDITKARDLNRNEWQSFAKDMRECGSAAFALARED